MNCKSCGAQLIDNAKYCSECGDKTAYQRITTMSLLREVAEGSFGWDNSFWLTLRTLFTKPEFVIQTFLNGGRKVFMNPFSLYAIILSISILIQSIIADQYLEFIQSISTMPNAFTGSWFYNMLQKYPSIISFLFMPIYACVSYFVYGKPYNYGEHLVIGFYINAIISLMGVFLTAFVFLKMPTIYFAGIYIIMFTAFFFIYQRLYKDRFVIILWRLAKLAFVLILPIILTIIGVVIYVKFLN